MRRGSAFCLGPAESHGLGRGDAAVEGASALLLSDTANDQIEKIIDICEYIELRDNPEFEALASECLRF